MRYDAILARPALVTSRAEILGAFSYALDVTEGQPEGHSRRACYIGSQVAREMRLPRRERDELYYTLLLKDLGCSSNAARIAELYGADDLAFKRSWKTIATGLPATLRFVFAKTAAGAPLKARVKAIANILANGDDIAQEMIAARCTRGSDIACTLGFSQTVCRGIYHLDEHWDGSGRPGHLRGDEIPLGSRIALLAQIADVFHSMAGQRAAYEEVIARAGTWLDPELVVAFQTIARREDFWLGLREPDLSLRLAELAPADGLEAVSEDQLDLIVAAFGEVIDAKSPYTSGHSLRVADYADALGQALGVLPARRRDLRRAAALHDIGKLGVSSAILEKPGKLDDAEWTEMRSHAGLTRDILGRISAFADLADLAAAHHERLDGKGYPLGLTDRELARETRIITTCDFYDAITADRPYRKAMPRDQALAIMQAEVGKAVDPECFAALTGLN